MAVSCSAAVHLNLPRRELASSSCSSASQSMNFLARVGPSLWPSSLSARRAAAAAASPRLAPLSQSLRQRLAGIAAEAGDSEEIETASASTKLYIGNLAWSVRSQQLAEIFQGIGSVELVEVVFDRETQRSRGFAFVTMGTHEEAKRSIDALDGHELEGRPLKVSFPQPSSTKDASRIRTERTGFPRGGVGGAYNSTAKLFVGNLSWGLDDYALDELFAEYGKVVEAKVVYDKTTGRSRGFGFVTFSSEAEVSAAIEALDGAEFDGRTLRVNRASDRPERRDSFGL